MRPARAALVLALAGSAFGAAGCGHDSDGACSRPFDRGRWRRAAHDDKRYVIAKRVVGCRLVAGASRAKVRRLLGPPLRSGKPKRVPARTWIYDAGFREYASGPGDDAFLWIYFTRQGRVRRALVSP